MSYLQEFEDHLAATRSPRTVAAYLGDLRLFAAWFAKTNGEEMSPQSITPLDVREPAAPSGRETPQAGHHQP